jgi:hypothetical protein
MWCPKPDAARQPRTRRQVIERLPIGRMGTRRELYHFQLNTSVA